MITADRVRELFHYDPETGVLTWKVDRHSNRVAGKPVSYINAYGYVQAKVDGRLRRVHRLAWLYVYGEWPNGEVDHINGVRNDNRISNLRLASRSQNGRNAKIGRKNKSGFKGVSWDCQHRKWNARVRLNGKSKNLGVFENKEDAAAAYRRAAAEIYGEFARFE